MKVTLRTADSGGFEAYVPGKDVEEPVVASEHPTLWGGWIELGNGWRLALPEMPADTALPITVQARRTSTGA
jgi:nitrogen fixation protein NifT